MTAVVIKLLTLWMLDDKFESNEPAIGIISKGIWETQGVQEIEDSRIYDLVCVMSYHKDIKVGDKKRMNEDVIIGLCHEVKLSHLPKVNKRDVIISNLLDNTPT